MSLIQELKTFAENFDTSAEDIAFNSRGQFLNAYPLNKLGELKLDDYIIGKGTSSFCACVEAKTKSWANIQGATAFKFGIYFGKTKSDPTMKYRFTQKFGRTELEAFENVKKSLLNLVRSAELQNFKDIDENSLSQMFKAKILSLYFPEIYFNVCSSEHLELLASELDIPEKTFVSEYQHLLVKKKSENQITKNWSNPKYMAYLYAKYIRKNLSTLPNIKIIKPRKKTRKKVDFGDLSANREAIGKISEEYAIEWERIRLVGLGLEELVARIEDRRDIPSYGYDYLSFNAHDKPRYIEVKSVGKDRKEGCFRFYLSENEFEISNSGECSEEYYFYLVFYDSNGKPNKVITRLAKELYPQSDIRPCAYIVRFDVEEEKT